MSYLFYDSIKDVGNFTFFLFLKKILNLYTAINIFYRVLWRIFGLKRDEMAGECRKLHNEELHDLYSSQSII
jgi:hypothetical protein